MLKRFENEMVVDMWGMIRKMTKEEKEWSIKVNETAKATKGKKRILDPFKGWIEK